MESGKSEALSLSNTSFHMKYLQDYIKEAKSSRSVESKLIATAIKVAIATLRIAVFEWPVSKISADF